MSERSPYETPDAAIAPAPGQMTRKPWLAALLGFIFPPAGMLYVARPVRAGAYLLILVATAIAALIGLIGLGLIGPFGWLFGAAAAIDSYRLARRSLRGPLPWYAHGGAAFTIAVLSFACVFSLRIFLFETFRVSSGSMLPTLPVGSHVAIDKTSYGWSNPFTRRRIATFASPKRGEVAVFRYPVNPDLVYVMRIVAGPGDTVAYQDKRLSLNGVAVPRTGGSPYTWFDSGTTRVAATRYEERLDDAVYSILVRPDNPAFAQAAVRRFKGRESCQYTDRGFTCPVPAGHYFVLGDNRDSSDDSRYWGFVPEENFLGRVSRTW